MTPNVLRVGWLRAMRRATCRSRAGSAMSSWAERHCALRPRPPCIRRLDRSATLLILDIPRYGGPTSNAAIPLGGTGGPLPDRPRRWPSATGSSRNGLFSGVRRRIEAPVRLRRWASGEALIRRVRYAEFNVARPSGGRRPFPWRSKESHSTTVDPLSLQERSQY